MPPKKLPKSKTGFFGVRAKPSGNFGVKFSDVGRRFCLGTYTTADKAARAYNVVVWRVRPPRTDLNFTEIETRVDAEFLMSECILMEEMTMKKTKESSAIVVAPCDSDDAVMARFAREHPEYVQAEQEYFLKHEAERKKEVKEDDVSPSTVIVVEFSKEDDEEYWMPSGEN